MNLARSPGVFLILGLCAAMYLLMAASAGALAFSPRMVADWGGMLPLHWLDGEYWRLITAGFLHYSLMHIVTNMLCLIMWGLPLERVIGTVRFIPLFLLSVVGGFIGSVWLRDGNFVSAGASGGISGLLGALLMLTLMRRIALPMQFFAINIAIAALAPLIMPNIDWQAHLGGFLTGMLAVAVLRPHHYME